MKRKRYSVEQIVAVLWQDELELWLANLARQTGNRGQIFYRRKRQFGRLEPDEFVSSSR